MSRGTRVAASRERSREWWTGCSSAGSAGLFLNGVWLILIGLFLREAATTSYEQVSLREVAKPLRVREVMTRDVVAVRADETVADIVNDFWSHRFTSFPVVQDQTVVGVASVHAVHTVPVEHWRDTTVRASMRPLTEELAIAPQAGIFEALEKIARNGLGRLAVLEGPRLVGYLSMKDISHVLVLQNLAGEPFARRLTWPRRVTARRSSSTAASAGWNGERSAARYLSGRPRTVCRLCPDGQGEDLPCFASLGTHARIRAFRKETSSGF